MEIPVNMLVILAISVIVLLSVVVFFIGGFTGPSRTLEDEQAFNSCASPWARLSCPGGPNDENDPNGWLTRECPNNEDDLRTVAENIGYNRYDEAAQAAGCRVDGTSGSGSGSDGSGSGGTTGSEGDPRG